MLPNFHAPKSGACQNEVYPASELLTAESTAELVHNAQAGYGAVGSSARRGLVVVSQASQRARGFMTRHKLFKAVMDASLGSS